MKGTWRRCCIEGLNLERFLRRAAENGICFKRIRRDGGRRIAAVVSDEDMEQLLLIAQQGGWQLTQQGALGIGAAAERVLKRRSTIACLLTALLIFAAAAQCILSINIVNAGAYEPDMLAYLEELGVRAPMRRADCDLERLREALSWRYPDISYIECAFRGVSLTIRIHEGQSGSDNAAGEESLSMVASRDGIVISVVTTSGTPAVEAGDIVRKGDTLIIGEEKGREGAVSSVRASGSVLARVWEEAHIVMPLTATDTQYTGLQETALNVASPWFSLWQDRQPSFAHYDQSVSVSALGGLFFPLQVRRTVYAEHILSRTAVSDEDARRQAEEAALQRLLADNGFADDFVDKWVEYSMIDNEVVFASAYGERVVDIAVYEGAQH